MNKKAKIPNNALLQSFIAKRAEAKGVSIRSVCREIASELGVKTVVKNWHYDLAAVDLMLIWEKASQSELVAEIFDLYLADYIKRQARQNGKKSAALVGNYG